jgi:uncharacterized protein YqgQ
MVKMIQNKIADKVFIAEELYRLGVIFPHETTEFFAELMSRIEAYEFTEKELVETVNRVIDSEARLTAASILKRKYEQEEERRPTVVE